MTSLFVVVHPSRDQKTLDGIVDNELKLLSHVPQDARAIFIPLLENFNLVMRIQAGGGLYVPALAPEVTILLSNSPSYA
jgi:hypothetical protein